eukprot:Ihof_evm2s937 gene=Ihof_evmTU2s937
MSPKAEDQTKSTGVVEVEKKKKSKKTKESTKEEIMVVDKEEKTEKKSEKKLKKEKKKSKKSKSEGESDVTPAESGNEEKKKSKKKSKSEETVTEKGKKRKSEEGEDKEDKAESKKAKTVKHSGDQGYYVEDPSVTAMTEEEVAEYRTTHGLSLEADQEYRPLRTFAEASCVPANILSVCGSFKTPTPIQAQAWPVCLSGRDMVGIAATGSGKTIAFSVPTVVYIKSQPALQVKQGKKGPLVLVLAPTRELAVQIEEVYKSMAATCGIRSTCIYGGVSKYTQISELKQGVHVIVATPGRLLAHIEEGALDLSSVGYLVLDEADRMLDMGFEPDIRRILACITGSRQTVMFSATWPKEIRALAAEFLKNPVKVIVGSDDLTANKNVKQIVEVLEPSEKDWRLLNIMKKYHTGKNRVLVFVLYKKEAPRVERYLRQKGFTCSAVHGDLNQFERTAAVEAFKSGKTPVLIATDVCARGLDIPKVELVVNYTFPLTVEDYVHRIGRTGRAGAKGTAITLFTVQEKVLAGPLSDVLK